VFLLFK